MQHWTLPPNLERRWKQHVRSQEHQFFAVVAPGFNGPASLELSCLGIENAFEEGGLGFSGKLEDMWKAHALCRIPNRILLRLISYRALRFEKLREVAKKFHWELFLRPDLPIEIKVSTKDSKLWHHDAVAETALQAIKARMREHYTQATMDGGTGPVQTVHLRMHKEEAQFSLDCSGQSLYMRGHDKWIAEAPIRDNLAFAIWMSVGLGPWDQVVDPCAGSGTFALEYALRQKGPLPGRSRSFAFEQFPGFKEASYNNLLSRLESEYLNQWEMPQILLRDRNAKTLEIARRNANLIQLDAQFECADLLKDPAPQLGLGSGLLISNLPYGDRLHVPGKEGQFFASIGRALLKHWQGWSFALVLPEGMEKKLGLIIDRKISFNNGGIPVVCAMGQIPRERKVLLPKVDDRYSDPNTFDY